MKSDLDTIRVSWLVMAERDLPEYDAEAACEVAEADH